MTTIPPTPINHEDVANAMIVELRDLAQSIPGFAYAAKGRRRKISSAARLPDAFLEAVAVACDASPQLAVASEITAADLRSMIVFSRAFTTVADEMNLVARGLLDTVAEQRAQTGQRALRAYAVAKSINRPEDRELLIPHLANMQRTIARGRRRTRPAWVCAARWEEPAARRVLDRRSLESAIIDMATASTAIGDPTTARALVVDLEPLDPLDAARLQH